MRRFLAQSNTSLSIQVFLPSLKEKLADRQWKLGLFVEISELFYGFVVGTILEESLKQLFALRRQRLQWKSQGDKNDTKHHKK
ncbi:MAG: hypothetical protein EA369_06935 [Bradymonadales bacterium]|nr:MAG: hypothetical protein EA369_06935 [Bradymonadales bacterium]